MKNPENGPVIHSYAVVLCRMLWCLRPTQPSVPSESKSATAAETKAHAAIFVSDKLDIGR